MFIVAETELELLLFLPKNNCIKNSQSESNIANLGAKASSRFPNWELGTSTRGFGSWFFALHKESDDFVTVHYFEAEKGW